MIVYSSSVSKGMRSGLALIAVLWVVVFMSSLLIVTLTLLKVDVDENVSEVQSFKAWQQAHTGLSIGLHPKVERDDPLLQSQDTGYDEGYKVIIEPESTRLNINHVLQTGDKQLLFSLFKVWGMEDKQVDQLIDALIDWVDGDELMGLNGAEKEYYEERGYYDRPYNRPFRELDELSLVRGFSELELVKPNWREYFTVWTEGAIDIHEAMPELLAAAAEVEVSVAEEYNQFVAGDDGVMGTEDDMRLTVSEALDDMLSPPGRRELISKRFTATGKVVRIVSQGHSGSYQCVITAISGGKTTAGSLLDYKEKRAQSE